jgi:hypothetical protein
MPSHLKLTVTEKNDKESLPDEELREEWRKLCN